MVLEAKQATVAALKERLAGSAGGVVVNYQGITVDMDTKMRSDLRAKGVEYTVVKNSLLRRAVEDSDIAEISGSFLNMTAIATHVSDAVAPAKVLCEYADKIPTFTVKSGFVEGKVVSVAEIEALSKLPAKEVLIAQMLGGLNAPISGLVNVLNGNISGLARVLQAVVDKKSESA
jgi:large subunit ribosomal protein L10